MILKRNDNQKSLRPLENDSFVKENRYEPNAVIIIHYNYHIIIIIIMSRIVAQFTSRKQLPMCIRIIKREKKVVFRLN